MDDSTTPHDMLLQLLTETLTENPYLLSPKRKLSVKDPSLRRRESSALRKLSLRAGVIEEEDEEDLSAPSHPTPLPNDISTEIGPARRRVQEPSTPNLALNGPATKAYLNRLASFPLSSLLSEPALLANEHSKILSTRSELAFAQYPAFLHAHSASAVVSGSLTALSTRLDTLTDARIAEFKASTDAFVDAATSLSEDRRKLSCLTSQYNTLLEVLELPQLVAACVRSSRYAEAMDLASHVKRLRMRYPDAEIIQRVAEETGKERGRMLNALLRLLAEETKLPGALRVIGYLRRGEALEDGERGLRIAFLKNRDNSLRKALGPLPSTSKKLPIPNSTSSSAGQTGDSVSWELRRRIDLIREHLFDVVTQYRALFSEGGVSGGAYLMSHGYGATSTLPNHLTSTTSSRTRSSSFTSNTTSSPSETTSSLTSTATDEATFLLSSHVTSVLSHHLLASLDTFLPQITDPSALFSVLSQTMYCGMSLGRAGIDFRKVVAPMFESTALRIAQSTIRAGVDAFIQEVETAIGVLPDYKKSISLLTVLNNNNNTSSYPTSSSSDTIPTSTNSQTSIPASSANSSASFAPPNHLVDYPPAARLCNAVLNAFNGLRSFAPVNVLPMLAEQLKKELQRAADALRQWADLASAGAGESSGGGMPPLASILSVLSDTLTPYLTRCLFEGVYGSVYYANGAGWIDAVSGIGGSTDDERKDDEIEGSEERQIDTPLTVLEEGKDSIDKEETVLDGEKDPIEKEKTVLEEEKDPVDKEPEGIK